MAETTKVEAKHTDTTAEAIQKLAEALIAQGPKSPLEMSGLSKEKQRALTEIPPSLHWRMIPGKSPYTGATFDMQIVESKIHKDGRVIQLHNYKHPPGTYQQEANGGLAPNGIPMFNGAAPAYIPEGHEPEKNSLSEFFKGWRWENFYKRDLRLIIGDGRKTDGALTESLCLNAAGMKTPWLEGSFAADDAA